MSPSTSASIPPGGAPGGGGTRYRFPDFIIAGAMKSGTTSLHGILASDPRIYIPKPEIFFFDMDDLFQHPEFCYRNRHGWIQQHYSPTDPKALAWYSSFFAPARSDQWIGEDSTTYLASTMAAERIARFSPTAKIILLLRDPAARTYSHYWHLVRTGRATLGFEDALQFSPGTLIQRSLYKPQVERFRAALGKDRLLVLLFEDFIADLATAVKRVYDFLAIPDPPPLELRRTHYNPAFVPRWPRPHLWWNWLRRHGMGVRRPHPHLPNVPSAVPKQRLARLADWVYTAVNPTLPRRPPPMSPATRRLLNEYFASANQGLDELVGKDLKELWYRG